MINGIKNINHQFSEWYVKSFKYEPYIQVLLLHKIYNSRQDIKSINGTISEGVDRNQFESLLQFYIKRKIEFIDESDIINGNLDPKKQYVYLTFDDGYYNNFNCLDILNKYKIKATFYISTNHIKSGKAYWWDALAHELTVRDKYSQFDKIVSELYYLKWYEQDKYLVDNFGEKALIPNNDIDRPMTVRELEKFAKNEYVTLGNHTDRHINLQLYTEDEIKDSILSAEHFLNSITNQPIQSISYPHGFMNDAIINSVKKMGYKIGITTKPSKNILSELNSTTNLLRLNRVQLSGFYSMKDQCRNFHTNNFSVAASIKKTFKK